MPTDVQTLLSVQAGHREQDLPCSGFSLCCIVHLLLLPDVLLLFGVVKLADPLFAAGLKSGRIGLCEQGARRRAIRTGYKTDWAVRQKSDPVALTLLSSASRLKFISAILSNVALQREKENKKYLFKVFTHFVFSNKKRSIGPHDVDQSAWRSWVKRPLEKCFECKTGKPQNMNLWVKNKANCPCNIKATTISIL